MRACPKLLTFPLFTTVKSSLVYLGARQEHPKTKGGQNPSSKTYYNYNPNFFLERTKIVIYAIHNT
jgi:hypothetical protein